RTAPALTTTGYKRLQQLPLVVSKYLPIHRQTPKASVESDLRRKGNLRSLICHHSLEHFRQTPVHRKCSRFLFLPHYPTPNRSRFGWKCSRGGKTPQPGSVPRIRCNSCPTIIGGST